MSDCTGCDHEKGGRCRRFPKQPVGYPPPPNIPVGHYLTYTPEGPLWQFPPADEPCGEWRPRTVCNHDGQTLATSADLYFWTCDSCGVRYLWQQQPEVTG